MTVVNVDVTKEAYFSNGKVFTGKRMQFGQNVSGPAHYDPSMPFINIIKTADLSVNNKSLTPDANGYYDLSGGDDMNIVIAPPDTVTPKAGVWILRWTGTATMGYSWRGNATLIQPNRIEFTVDENGDGFPSNLQPSNGTLSNLSLVHEDNITDYDNGLRIEPQFLQDIAGSSMIRFMDWMQTNDSAVIDFSDYPTEDYISYFLHRDTLIKGVPIKVMCEVANRLNITPWFNIPAKATDACVTAIATEIDTYLSPSLKAWIEYCNECWNYGMSFSDATNWVYLLDAPVHDASVDPETGVVTDIGHGHSTGDEIIAYTTTAHRDANYGAGNSRFVIVDSVDTFRIATNLENAQAGISIPTNSSSPATRLYYKKSSEASVLNVDANYATRAVEVWDLCESVLGARLLKVGAGQYRDPSRTVARCANLAFKRGLHRFAVAPYIKHIKVPNFENLTLAEISADVTETLTAEFAQFVPELLAAIGRDALIAYECGEEGTLPISAPQQKVDKAIEYANSSYIQHDYEVLFFGMSNYGFKVANHLTSHSSDSFGGTYGLMKKPGDTTAPKYVTVKPWLDNGGVPKNG